VRREFDRGYYRQPYRRLVADFPDETVYPLDSFRVEWGPVFHRGRLDGTARILVIGQDPATHEVIARRILVGEAGQRVQGLLTRLGIERSYVLVNTYLYPVFGQRRGERHIDDEGITAYRNRWLDAVVDDQPIEAIITLGHLAHTAYQRWRTTPTGAANTARYGNVIHPTYPDSASRSGALTKAEAFARLCTSWNAVLEALHPAITPDTPVPLRLYGTTLTRGDLTPIPPGDLPAGLPDWMCALDTWARRTGTTKQVQRATITVSVPRSARRWPPLSG
jgi:Uracil DNA glycosylase superfamily